MRFVALQIVAGAFFLMAGSAYADDFNFTVPVNFNNLPPDVSGAAIDCAAYQEVYGVLIGGGETRISISGGAYRGDVTLHFNATAGHDPAAARYYSCKVLTFFGRSGTQYVFGSATEPFFPLQPGAPFLLDTAMQPLPR